jgi:YHS domain-containing protein
MRATILVPLVLSALLLTGASFAQDKATVPFYGNATCPVMTDKPINKRFFVEHEGQRIYVCCKKCLKVVQAKPEEYLPKAYPPNKVTEVKAEKCVVMGKDLKANAEAVVWQGYKVPLCCKKCVAKFLEEPNKTLTRALNPTYTMAANTMCPVMPEEKVVRDNFFVYKGQIINLCCDSCVQEAQDDPEKVLKALKDQGKK